MLPQVPNPSCRIGKVHPNTNVDLAWRGGTFTGLAPVEAIAFRASGTDATAVVETSDLLLVGEVFLHRVLVAPMDKDLLVDGYLELRRARIAHLAGDRAALAPMVPACVRPGKEPALELPCASLALGSAEPSAPAGRPAALRPGSHVELATTPGGTPVATIHTPHDALTETAPDRAAVLPDVRLLERRGAFARIVVREPGTGVVGWIAASALSRSRTTAPDTAPAASVPPRPSLRCPHVVTVFLRHGDDVVIAGRFKPRAPIPTLGHDTAGELRVVLPLLASSLGDERRGDEPEPPVVYVRDEEVKGCRLEP